MQCKWQGLSRKRTGTLLARLLFPLPTYFAITVSLLCHAPQPPTLPLPTLGQLHMSCCHLICTEPISGPQTFPIYVDIALLSVLGFLILTPVSMLFPLASQVMNQVHSQLTLNARTHIHTHTHRTCNCCSLEIVSLFPFLYFLLPSPRNFSCLQPFERQFSVTLPAQLIDSQGGGKGWLLAAVNRNVKMIAA